MKVLCLRHTWCIMHSPLVRRHLPLTSWLGGFAIHILWLFAILLWHLTWEILNFMNLHLEVLLSWESFDSLLRFSDWAHCLTCGPPCMGTHTHTKIGQNHNMGFSTQHAISMNLEFKNCMHLHARLLQYASWQFHQVVAWYSNHEQDSPLFGGECVA